MSSWRKKRKGDVDEFEDKAMLNRCLKMELVATLGVAGYLTGVSSSRCLWYGRWNYALQTMLEEG